MSDLSAFRLEDPLPHGRLAIEASAGTGKTHTLSTLAARYVAEEGVPIGELLVVTFTRAAAAELKDRVRRRLVELAAVLRNPDRPADEALAVVWAADREQRLRNVERALTDFDTATITTIHGFAQQVIGTLGASARIDPNAVLVDDAAALTEQVATDVLVSESVTPHFDIDALPDLDQLRVAVGLSLGNPDAVLVPDVALPSQRSPGEIDDDEAAAEQLLADRQAAVLRALVDEVVYLIGARRLTAGTLSFDDLLRRLRDALGDVDDGAAARATLAERYRVVLIDEFQDTDPVQWKIFDTVFGEVGSDGAVVIVGDPKQAIYAFRGANVHTYLDAARAPGTTRTSLDRNWRSDPASLRATEALLDGVTFGADEIRFQHVEAPAGHAERTFTTTDGEVLPAMSIRLAGGDVASAGSGEAMVFREVATYVRDLLETAAVPDGDDVDGGGIRPLRPDDVCVLIAANRHGPVVRDALRALDIPAVISRGDNVLASEAASHWHHLLHAVARPTDVRRARGAALSWFFGWDAGRLAAAGDDDIAEVQEQLHRWGEHLIARGVAAFAGQVFAQSDLAGRVLALPDGDRAMTDLDHIAELLSIASARSTSPATLLTTFEQLSGGSDDGDPEADLAARRVESESRAVQIMTTYVAKGLEFPVVCCPTLWSPYGAKVKDHVWWDETAGKRTIDVASRICWGSTDDQADRARRTAKENVGSDLRVLYVALTRAKHHTAVWWLPTREVWKGALARVLFARTPDGVIDRALFESDELDHLDAAASAALLTPVAARAGGTLEVRAVSNPGPRPRRWAGAAPLAALDLSVATLDRALDRHRARWSFTAITARSHAEHAWGDPFDDAVGDAGAADEGVDVVADAGLDAAGPGAGVAAGGDAPATLLLGDIAGGAGFGTLVHEILEQIDFTSTDLEAELALWVDDRLAWNPWPVDRDQLVAGLAAVVRTPLGPLFAGRALADLAPVDRLDELSFDLTLGERGQRATDAQLGAMVLDHLSADDPMRPWAASLASGPFDAVLAGHLTGSIDLVARVRHADGVERFVVSDYKTNRLAARGEVATAAHFAPDQLPAAMAEHHYALQALLYGVALHRYLRWRVADYDPAVHLGGVGYLFVRGMVGPATPTVDGVPHGLFDWRPTAALVTDLSDLLDGAGR